MKKNIRNRKDMMKIKKGRREKRKRKGRSRNTVLSTLVALPQANIQVKYFLHESSF